MALQVRPVVLDASVVLKWQLFDEPYVRQADVLRADLHVRRSVRGIAPQLFVYEVVNGIVSAVRQRRLAATEAAEALGNLMALGIELVAVSPHSVLELSLTHGLSAYDAAYLALAQAGGCELWTGDKPFYDSIKGASPLVRWIGDYPVVS